MYLSVHYQSHIDINTTTGRIITAVVAVFLPGEEQTFLVSSLSFVFIKMSAFKIKEQDTEVDFVLIGAGIDFTLCLFDHV